MQWCDQSDEDINKNKVKLAVTYDMGWKKISPGRRYDSSSGHAFVVSGLSNGVIGMGLHSKVF